VNPAVFHFTVEKNLLGWKAELGQVRFCVVNQLSISTFFSDKGRVLWSPKNHSQQEYCPTVKRLIHRHIDLLVPLVVLFLWFSGKATVVFLCLSADDYGSSVFAVKCRTGDVRTTHDRPRYISVLKISLPYPFFPTVGSDHPVILLYPLGKRESQRGRLSYSHHGHVRTYFSD